MESLQLVERESILGPHLKEEVFLVLQAQRFCLHVHLLAMIKEIERVFGTVECHAEQQLDEDNSSNNNSLLHLKHKLHLELRQFQMKLFLQQHLLKRIPPILVQLHRSIHLSFHLHLFALSKAGP